jgi:ubiquinone/menaquinone biosynthesis C-methylase UbiE
MFTESANYYDLIYSDKDYAAEVKKLHDLISKFKTSDGKTLLDVACGTGRHLEYLKRLYEVEGLDLDPVLLAAAQPRLPGVALHKANMMDFDLGKRFDIILCLFSAIGYVKTVSNLNSTVANFSRHLKRGGVIVIEPWFSPDTYIEGMSHAVFKDTQDVKLCRMNVSAVGEKDTSVLDFHYLVADNHGVEHFTERHELGLFSNDDYARAIKASGLGAHHDSVGLTGRGLHLGVSETNV